MNDSRDHMDDLFNKAGHDYPLNTGSPNWNAIHKMVPKIQAPAVQAGPSRRLRLYYTLLLLLVFFPLLIPSDKSRVRNNANPRERPDISETKQAKRPVPNTGPTNTSETSIRVRRTNPSTQEKILAQEHLASEYKVRNQIKKKEQSSPKVLNYVHRDSAAPDVILKNQLDHYSRSKSSFGKKKLNGTLLDTWRNMEEIADNSKGEMPKEIFKHFTRRTYSIQSLASFSSPNRRIKKSSFYFGILGGPDLSTIKYQQVKKAGYSAGIIAGYRINEQWSVEAVGLWSEKKYYTDGKYFDKTNANIPSSTELYSLDGACSMYEIPIVIRYQFKPGKRSLFASAGLNSYLMTKETYSYKANAAGWLYNGLRTYKNSGNYLFSNLQLSAGYQRSISDKIDFRIEPYFQAPLKRIGIGKMPVISAGVHFGLIRHIW